MDDDFEFSSLSKEELEALTSVEFDFSDFSEEELGKLVSTEFCCYREDGDGTRLSGENNTDITADNVV